MKKHFVKFIAMLLVCIFAISGVNFSIFAAGDTAELGEKLSAMNVEVSGKISLMLYFKNLDDVSYFKVTVPNRDGSSTTRTVEKSDLKYDSTKDRYLLKVAFAAAQQTDKARIQAFSRNDVGSVKVYEYSVKDYADIIFELATTNQSYSAVSKVIKSMLNYGAMAQKHFGYNMGSLANDGLYGNVTNPVDDMSDNDMYGIEGSSSYTTNDSIINFAVVNAYLDDVVCLRFYVDYKGTACATEDLKVLINSVEYKNEVVRDDNGDYYILINNIPATCFNDQYQVKISDGTEYAETSYSVFNYLQRRLELTQDEAFANVVYSMFQFYVSTSTHTDRDIPGFDSMEAACTHERTYIDSKLNLLICSDCGCELGPAPKEPVNNIDAVYPLVGSEVVLANDLIYDFWQRFDNTPSTYPEIIHEDRYYPVPVTLQWRCKEHADYYLVYVSLNKDLSNAMSFVSTYPSVLIENLFVGYDYYWQVDAIVGNKTLRSEIFTFSTAMSPRAVAVEGVSNTRDIGGYITADGNRIKQGMVYRGGKLEGITARGKWQFLYGLGIKTDLDLRTPGEGGAGISSPVSNSLNYVNVDGRYYVESVTGIFGINSEAGKAFIAEEIRVFTNPNNFPVYIHCSLGRDRTGTLVFLLQALCGMEERDLIMDYELSIFSVTGTLDNANPASHIIATYDYINNNFAGESFAKKTENFLLSIGITAEEIATIRSILVEEVQ